MKFFRIPLAMVLVFGVLASPVSLVTEATAQNQSSALERGFRTGYSDGYNAGFRDISDQAPRDFQNKSEYQRADRNYNETWGTAEDYRDGYQQGFEAGYGAGYERRAFNSSIPAGLARRGTTDPGPASAPSADDDNQNTSVDNSNNTSVPVINQPVIINRDQVLLIELQTSLSTEASQQGDRFQARVVDPRELDGAVIEGRVLRVKRAGKLKGSSELQLAFETIRTVDNRTGSMRAQVIEVVDMGQGGNEAGSVDSEGGVRGKDSTKNDISKVGASTGIGAIIGAIVGGGKGAAIGAAIGGSMGTAGVLSSRGKDLRLSRGQQLRIRTATESRIQ
ncbi:MAG TPA: hypothetical protein VJU86_09890 [Pyrinomonadaceae bacterium]|nr:hypothetical protein [Pyrinomonadaceae bacterium]